MKNVKMDVCYTVEELIEQLKKLPPALPVKQGFDEGVRPILFNRNTDPFLEITENDGTWDD